MCLGLYVGHFGSDSSERFLLVASVSSVIEGQSSARVKLQGGAAQALEKGAKGVNRDFRVWGKDGQGRWRPIGGPGAIQGAWPALQVRLYSNRWLACIILQKESQALPGEWGDSYFPALMTSGLARRIALIRELGGEARAL